MPELERSYRRWLYAYPAFYRRERGLEILTTLLDSAEPGQTRPSRGEAAYVLLMGLRYRFVPVHWIGAIATVLVAIWAALVVGGAGASAVWAVADPQKPDVAALSDALAGRAPTSVSEVSGAGPLDMAVSYEASGEFQSLGREGWSGRWPAPMGDVRYYDGVGAAVVPTAHQRLAGEGWQTGELTEGVFWAQRAGVLIRVAGHEDGSGVQIGAFPVEPGGVLAGAVTGFTVGLLLVWQAMTALTHRIARTPRSTRRLLLLIGFPGLAACAANSVDSVFSMIPDVDAVLGPIPGGRVLLAADLMYPLASQLASPLAFGLIAISVMSCVALVMTAEELRPGPTVELGG